MGQREKRERKKKERKGKKTFEIHQSFNYDITSIIEKISIRRVQRPKKGHQR